MSDGSRPVSSQPPQPGLPPGQQLAAAAKWPVVGEREAAPSDGTWTVSLEGLVVTPRRWTLDELREMPQVERCIDVHCVTRWTKPQMRFRGVPLDSLLQAATARPEARFVSFVAHSPRQHSTSLPLEVCRDLGVLLALEADGAPLTTGHGGPVRTVTPGRYFFKSLKWLRRIELLRDDSMGFWEAEAGYHNEADPLREQRYLAPNLDRKEAARLLTARDLEGRDLRSLDAAGRELRGLRAEGALLRDADFRGADLQQARLARANLSNAHLQRADLRGADLRAADLEGANLEGADLRGADLRGASLFGATLWVPDDNSSAAVLDATTQVDPAVLEQLVPEQARFLRGWLP
jgi:DMSO/TMAO reductase YedYZ molybdopterin-dependent catalytic subunit